jgi:transposase-like protein
VRLAISDAHKGLKAAIRGLLGAEWQRCKVRFFRNVLGQVPKRSQAEVSEAMKAVFAQRDEESAKAKAEEVLKRFRRRFPKAMEVFEQGSGDVLSYPRYPVSHRVRISSTNPLERLNLEIRRRTRVVGIFPNRGAYPRLVGMILLEQNEDWITGKLYLSLEQDAQEEAVAAVLPMAAGK